MLLYYTGKPFCFCSRHLTEGIDQKTIVLYTSLLGSTDRVLFCRPVFTNDRRDSASIYFRLNNSTLRNWCLCGLSHESWMNRTHQQQFEAIRFPRCCATDSLCEAAALATKNVKVPAHEYKHPISWEERILSGRLERRKCYITPVDKSRLGNYCLRLSLYAICFLDSAM